MWVVMQYHYERERTSLGLLPDDTFKHTHGPDVEESKERKVIY